MLCSGLFPFQLLFISIVLSFICISMEYAQSVLYIRVQFLQFLHDWCQSPPIYCEARKTRGYRFAAQCECRLGCYVLLAGRRRVAKAAKRGIGGRWVFTSESSIFSRLPRWSGRLYAAILLISLAHWPAHWHCPGECCNLHTALWHTLSLSGFLGFQIRLSSG